MQDREAQFIDSLYLGARDRAGFERSLDLLADIFSVASVTLFDFDAVRPDVTFQASVGILSGETLDKYQEFAAFDPAPLAFSRLAAGNAHTTYRLLPEEAKRPGVFFSEFFRPAGMEECLGGTLATANGRFALVGLQRTPDRKVFDDADILRLEGLLPHIGRALQLRRGFIELEGMTGALSEICDRLAAGVSALDERGVGLFTNSAARRIAAAKDGLSLDRRGRPVAMNRDVNISLAELENDVRSGGSGGKVRVPRPAGKPPYTILVAPFIPSDAADPSRPRPRGVIFVIHDPLRADLPTGPMIGQLFGLPRATANLAAAIAGGEDMQDYASRHGISINTARYHLKTAFDRIGVHSQSELTRRIILALRDLSDHREGG